MIWSPETETLFIPTEWLIAWYGSRASLLRFDGMRSRWTSHVRVYLVRQPKRLQGVNTTISGRPAHWMKPSWNCLHAISNSQYLLIFFHTRPSNLDTYLDTNDYCQLLKNCNKNTVHVSEASRHYWHGWIDRQYISRILTMSKDSSCCCLSPQNKFFWGSSAPTNLFTTQNRFPWGSSLA